MTPDWMNALFEDLDRQGLTVISKKNYDRMIKALEFIEKMGSEMGHEGGDNCGCGACMGSEARRCLEEKA